MIYRYDNSVNLKHSNFEQFYSYKRNAVTWLIWSIFDFLIQRVKSNVPGIQTVIQIILLSYLYTDFTEFVNLHAQPWVAKRLIYE